MPRRRRARRAPCRLLHVLRDDAAMRARAANLAKIDALLGRQPPRQRRHERRRPAAAPDRNCARACAPRRTDRARSAPSRRRGGTTSDACGAMRGHALRQRRLRRRCRRRHRCRLRRGLCGFALTAAPLPSEITATTAPTGATSPAPTRISASTPGRGRRHLHRHLVGLDLEQVVAGLHGIAGRLEPFGDLALGHGLAELRHQHVHAAAPGCHHPRKRMIQPPLGFRFGAI